MKDFDVQKVVETYYDATLLKYKVRTGWKYWNVSDVRRETVAEHIFGAQQLAWFIYSESGIELDIFKVIAMLSLHETEEIHMPDFAPYDPIPPEEIKRMGKESVEEALGGLKMFGMFDALIDEFDARETPEAKFAHLCDKLECDMHVKRYSDGGYCNIEGRCEVVRNDPETQQIIANGAKTVAEVFMTHDEYRYKGTIFEEIAEFVKNYTVPVPIPEE